MVSNHNMSSGIGFRKEPVWKCFMVLYTGLACLIICWPKIDRLHYFINCMGVILGPEISPNELYIQTFCVSPVHNCTAIST